MKLSPKLTNSIIVLYDPGQLEEGISYFKEHKCQIFTINFWLERELEKMGVPYFSCADLHLPGENQEYLDAARTAAREWYRIKEMDFFEYKGIPLGEAFEPMMDFYLQRFLYYMRIFEGLLAEHPEVTRLIVPYTGKRAGDTIGPLGPFEMRVVVDAAKMVARAKGVECEDFGLPPGLPSRHTFPRESWETRLISLYNKCMRLAPKKPVKIFASEHWFYIKTAMDALPDAELVLMERSEARRIPWRSLFRHRIRFIHPLMVASARPVAAERLAAFINAWPRAKKAVASLPFFEANGMRWWEAVEPAFDYLVGQYAERAVADIEGLEHVMRAEGSNRIVLRASIGGRQYHFFLAARVARRLGIPSIEIQHAGMVFDKQSVHSHLETDYLAAYGEVEKEQYAKNGYASERIVPVGSPRFEAYEADRGRFAAKRDETLRRFGLDPQKPVLMCAVPAEQLGLSYLDFDSYDIAAFFHQALAIQKEVPNLQILFKLRPGNPSAHREYLKGLFKDGMAIAEFENPLEVICAGDIASSGNSTMLYESMLAGKPTILFPWRTWDPNLPVYQAHMPYAKDGILLAKLLTDVLQNGSKEISEKEKAFLAKHLFDGHSSKRTALLIREIAASKIV